VNEIVSFGMPSRGSGHSQNTVGLETTSTCFATKSGPIKPECCSEWTRTNISRPPTRRNHPSGSGISWFGFTPTRSGRGSARVMLDHANCSRRQVASFRRPNEEYGYEDHYRGQLPIPIPPMFYAALAWDTRNGADIKTAGRPRAAAPMLRRTWVVWMMAGRPTHTMFLGYVIWSTSHQF